MLGKHRAAESHPKASSASVSAVSGIATCPPHVLSVCSCELLDELAGK